MPHCILEYSDNIDDNPDFVQLLTELNQALADTEHFKLNDIKSRAIKHSSFVIGDNDPTRSYVTLNIQIFDGRSDDIKARLSGLAYSILAQHFPKTAQEDKASLTVQISDIHRASYRKK